MANDLDGNKRPTIPVSIEIKATDAGTGLASAFVQLDDGTAAVDQAFTAARTAPT